MPLAGAVHANVAISADPTFLEGLFDFIGAWSGVGCRAGDQDREILTIVISRVVLPYSHGMNRSTDADIAEVGIIIRRGFLELCHDVVFVRKADPLAGGVPHMHM